MTGEKTEDHGIVHPHVDGAELLLDLLGGGLDGGGVGDVGGDEDGVGGAHGLALVGCGGKGFGVAGEQSDGVSAFGEGMGDGATKAGR